MQSASIKWVDSVRDISKEFFDMCFPLPKEGFWWYDTLERSGLEDQFKFAYAIIHKGDEPVGIAPTFEMDVPMELIAPPRLIKLIKSVPLIGKLCPFLIRQKTLFIGSPCADEGTVGLVPGVELAAVAPSLQVAVEKRAAKSKVDMMVWKDFCPEDADQLAHLSTSCNLFKVVSYPGTILSIPADGMEGYYRNLKRSKRYSLKRNLRRSKERAEMDVEVVKNPPPEVLDDIFKLFWQTYERGKTKFEKLNYRFFELIAQVDVARFIILRNHETSRLAAFMLCFQLGDKVINKFIGLDYGIASETYLYFRLWEAALGWAISTGASEFQSGQTGYRAKIDVGHSLVPLTNYAKHRNGISHKIYAEISKTISWKTLDTDLKLYLESHPEQ